MRAKTEVRFKTRRGFTLVELLVSISFIGLLLALLLPAIQSARESSRRVQCRNNLKQISLGFQNHESSFQHFPSNGWGYLWMGDPDSGEGPPQPGGWIYQLLPQLERNDLRQLGSGSPPTIKPIDLGELTEAVVPVFHCPSRPESSLTPQYALNYRNCDWQPNVFKTHYAVCEGDFFQESGVGPASKSASDLAAYPWINPTLATGVCIQRVGIRLAEITDGSSNTYLVGEKYVRTSSYNAGGDPGHDQSAFAGDDLDNKRWVIDPPLRDGITTQAYQFGSAHQGGLHMSFCDGSVKLINYHIDVETHRRLGNRQDGLPVEMP